MVLPCKGRHHLAYDLSDSSGGDGIVICISGPGSSDGVRTSSQRAGGERSAATAESAGSDHGASVVEGDCSGQAVRDGGGESHLGAIDGGIRGGDHAQYRRGIIYNLGQGN